MGHGFIDHDLTQRVILCIPLPGGHLQPESPGIIQIAVFQVGIERLIRNGMIKREIGLVSAIYRGVPCEADGLNVPLCEQLLFKCHLTGVETTVAVALQDQYGLFVESHIRLADIIHLADGDERSYDEQLRKSELQHNEYPPDG